MRLLYSNILPLATDEGQETITEAINNQMQSADRIEIAVGYVSRASLEELDLLIEQNNIKNKVYEIKKVYNFVFDYKSYRRTERTKNNDGYRSSEKR